MLDETTTETRDLEGDHGIAPMRIRAPKDSGYACQFCDSPSTKVENSWEAQSKLYPEKKIRVRRRKCEACGRSFVTREEFFPKSEKK